MNYKAILFGSIGTLIETSELQRNAFNQAFSENGLGWNWSPAQYHLKALSDLNLKAEDCVAIEDTEVSMQSALAASIKCIGFPGAFAKDNDFSSAILVTDILSFNDLP